MSYSVNGKIYTDNALMDEIVYNTKIILNGIVVKNEIVALSYETETSLEKADEYRLACERIYPFEKFPFTYELFIEYGYTVTEAIAYMEDRNRIPENERDPLMDFCMQDFVANFTEYNKYYRSLMGLPEYGTDKYNIYIDPSWIPSDYTDPVDFSVPIHEQTKSVINLLYQTGKIAELIKQYRSFNYSYLRYLGDKKIDLYTARMANRWDILYMPTVNSLVQDRFQELYNTNKEMFNKRFYQEAYNASGENYYDEVTIIMLLAQTFADIVTDVPEWYIRRDIFDVRSVQYFLDSYGIPYFSEIPLKYQIRIVKNLNKLIMDKSTDVCNQDILDILELNDAVIYKYFLYKQRRVDGDGQYITDGPLEQQYNLKFIQVKQGDTYDNYIKNKTYLANYDDTTEKDEYWDSVNTHEKVKHDILERDFTIEPSKYIAIETNVDYGEYMKEIKYFLGLILDSRLDENDVSIPVTAISEGGSYKLSNLFLLLTMLSGAYYDFDDRVRRPSDMNEETQYRPDGPIDMNTDKLYWMQQRYPEYFEVSDERYYGFNPNADLAAIAEVIGRPYVGFNYNGGGYTLQEFGADSFIPPTEINSIADLLLIYDRNINVYNTLNNIIHYQIDNKDKQLAAQYIFTQLFTKEFDYGAYTDNENLRGVLKGRDYSLYLYYMDIISETETEVKRENIKAVLTNIISTLEFYLNTSNLKYLYSFTPLSSFASLLKYAYLLINVFKSYKIHLIDANIAYNINSISDSHEAGYDTIIKKKLFKSYRDRHNVFDVFLMIIKRSLKDISDRKDMREYAYIRSVLEYPDDESLDYDGGTASSTEYESNSYDGGSASTAIPYSCINGGSSYLTRNDYWDVNGLNIDTPEPGEYGNIDLDGGNITNVDHEYESENNYFTTNFNHIVEGGNVRSDLIVDDSFFIRISDYQDRAEVEASIMTGMNYSENKQDREIILTEAWRYWARVGYVLDKYNMSLYHLNKLKNEIHKIKIVDVHTKYETGVRDIPDIPNADSSDQIIVEY